MKALFDLFLAHTSGFVAGGGTMAGGLVGATGQIPDGIPPLAWLGVTLLGPIITGLVWRTLRVRDARKAARLEAAAAELERCALEHEAKAKVMLEDADAANDGDARKLLAASREERIEAAADRAEAEQIRKEGARRPGALE